jgi:MoaA/NifB/PqqE/SkfB family radical SAM enzyme
MLPIEIKRDLTRKQYFQINWMLHDRCTYACSYCPPSNHAGTDNWLKLDKIINTCQRIESQVKSRSPDTGMQILLGGGEPTVWKDFPKLAEYFHDNNWSIHMVTNLSRSLNWWESLSVRWNCLNISLHAEYIDEVSLAEKIEYLQEHCDVITLRAMIHPDEKLFKLTIDTALNLKSRFPKLSLLWIPILYEFGGVNIDISPYSDEQRKIIEELPRFPGIDGQKIDIIKKIVWSNQLTTLFNPQDLVNRGLNKFNGWSCDAGLDGIFIDGKGDISRGTCREGDTIGNILDSDFQLPYEPITCSRNSCTCITDVLYSKRKI